MRSKNIFAVIIIAIGAVLLLEQFGVDLNIGAGWPFFLLIPGVLFWVGYYTSRDTRDNFGLLIPGTILIVYSAYFFILEATNGAYAAELSFMFTFGVALAFFAAHYLSKAKPKGLKIAGWVLTIVSLITLLSTISTYDWWPAILIVIGVLLLLQRNTARKKAAPRETADNASPASDAEATHKPDQE